MREGYEDAFALSEETHPWYSARRALFTKLAGLRKNARILDVGCGSGMFLVHLKSEGFQDLTGVETSMVLRQRFRDDSIPLYSAIPDETFDAVFLLDVLEHIVDDIEALKGIHRALRPDGKLILSVPAHPFLWGPHDIVNEHKRRYRRNELRDKLNSVGFEIHRFSYWNMFVFPVACLVRWLHVARSGDAGDTGLGFPAVLKIYGWVLQFENRLLHRFNLPAGMSLIATAHARGETVAPD